MATGNVLRTSDAAAVQAELGRVCQELQGALGQQLTSVVLYGGLARGEYTPGSSDINLMIVVKQVTTDVLDCIARLLQVRLHRTRLAPLVLDEQDLHRSTDVFPIKFLNMQRCYRTLAGKDVLSDLQISDAHLRLRCEQEIKNLMLRLRRLYLAQRDFPERLRLTLCRSVSSLLTSLAVLVQLKSGEPPHDTLESLHRAEHTGLNLEPVRRILTMKREGQQLSVAELKRLYGEYMEVVQRVAEVADSL